MVHAASDPSGPQEQHMGEARWLTVAREADETFIGGKPKNMHSASGCKCKTAHERYAEKATVMGILDRDLGRFGPRSCRT